MVDVSNQLMDVNCVCGPTNITGGTTCVGRFTNILGGSSHLVSGL